MKPKLTILNLTPLILLVVYNALAFLLPIIKTPSFWIAYFFTTLAFLIVVGINFLILKTNDSLTHVFLGLPLIYVGLLYFIFQFIISTITLLVPMISPAISLAVNILLLGWFLAISIFTNHSQRTIKAIDNTQREKTNFIKRNYTTVNLLLPLTKNPDANRSLVELSQLIRFSDPMSQPSLRHLEIEIDSLIDALSKANNHSNSIEIITISTQIKDLMLKRNALCKSQK